YSNAEFVSFERLFLLALMLCWKPPTARERSTAMLLGLLLGLGQWAKFGAGIIAGLALVLFDVLFLLRDRSFHENLSSYLRSMSVTASAALVVVTMQATVILATCPVPIARDAIFPIYIRESYLGSEFFPRFSNMSQFVGQQLLLLICAGL